MHAPSRLCSSGNACRRSFGKRTNIKSVIMFSMHRNPQSHKGENGKVMIIGGSKTQHGAPIFSALPAEASGVDLIFIALPAVHADTAKNSSLNFQVHPFESDTLKESDLESILELLATMDA